MFRIGFDSLRIFAETSIHDDVVDRSDEHKYVWHFWPKFSWTSSTTI